MGPHNCVRNSVANNDATSITVSVLGSPTPYGPGSTMLGTGVSSISYWQKTSAVVQAPATSLPGGVCPAALTAYTGRTLRLHHSRALRPQRGDVGAHLSPARCRTYGANQGASVSFGGNTYTLNSGQPATPASFTTSCGVASPYTGGNDNCNSVIGGCTLTSSAPFLVTQTGSAQTYFNNINTPGPGWVITNTTAQAFNYQLTQVGQSCPPVGTVVTATSGPANWQFLATSNYAMDHNWQTDPACDTSLQHTCTWTMAADVVGTGEIPQQFCTWQRTQYTWAPQIQQCTYTTKQWSYTYTPPPILTCSLKKWTVYFGRPSYWYTFQPNPGDLLGATNFTWNGNNDAVTHAHCGDVQRRKLLQRGLPEPHSK